jgi:hypothetical protein
VDGDAGGLAREMGDIFLRGIDATPGKAISKKKPATSN